MSDFDVIVVGAGYAGTVAAYELALEGRSVLLVERGDYAGAKNMTGGRIYAHSLRRVFPDTFDQIPFERKIVQERITMLTPHAGTTVSFLSDAMLEDGQESYAVLSATLNRWLCDQAEDAGAVVACGVRVDELVKDGAGKVVGIKAGDDEMTAEVVILCDGVNSLLTQQAFGVAAPAASHIAVGVKQVFALPAQTITDRIMAADDDQGCAWLFAGDATQGLFGGGFMYTNKESVSLGVVVGAEALARSNAVPVYQMLEDLKRHPVVAPLIKDAAVVEHSGHMVPEGGITMMPPLFGDGVLVAGDAAMLCINLGYMVRGMDYAVASGQTAARAALQALEAHDTSRQGLSCYERMLKESFVLQDLEHFRRVPAFLGGFDRMFNAYPSLAADVLNTLFIVDGTPVEPLKRSVMPKVKSVGLMNMFKDVRGAMKAL